MASTVDVLVGSEDIAEYLEYCRIHHTDYGSDYRPIALSYWGCILLEPRWNRKRLYKEADWNEIRTAISSQLSDSRFIKEITDVDTFERAADVFVNGINAVLEDHVLRARESPYTKRW
jgi:hypothetical protein